MMKQDAVKQDADRKGLETCVICRCMTDIQADTDISQRKTYVPTIGQLCDKCCWEWFHTNDIRTLPEFYDEFD
ncbi:hypothetical protein D3Z50_03075 [Clostridiaceae bacterium]|jgi:hypothetical protein|nr:hypothetical protein [Clostridiaceae bacterium]